MNILAFILGIGLTTVIGCLSVAILQGKKPVLTSMERLACGITLGPTISMFLVFVLHILGLTSFTLLGFLVPILVLLIIVVGISAKQGTLRAFVSKDTYVTSHEPLKKATKIVLVLLCIWTGLKLLAGAYDLTLVPSYWDDSFNNWNMRAKLFYQTEKLTLEIPNGNGAIQSAQGVSSYPPTVPMVKTWLSVLRGSFQETLINSAHIVWLLGLLLAFFATTRRYLSTTWSVLALYGLVSLPLFLIHGSNPYADIFVAAHLFLVVMTVLGITRSANADNVKVWLRLFGLTLGLLIFTKNEALILHAPLLLLAAAWALYDRMKAHVVQSDVLPRAIGMAALLILAVVIPWLGFKWINGLTFGNAKSVSGVSFVLNPQVVRAIWFHFSTEPNWLLLPFVLPFFLIVSYKKLLQMPVGVLTLIVCASIIGQMTLFLIVPSLATEAIDQTGISRGLLQIAPIAMLLTTLLVSQSFRKD